MPRKRTTQQQRYASKAYLRNRDQYRAAAEKAGLPCHLCGQPIDYQAEAGTSEAFEVDHFHPVSTHPALFEDKANFRPSHKRCNLSRGNKEVAPTLGRLSEEW